MGSNGIFIERPLVLYIKEAKLLNAVYITLCCPIKCSNFLFVSLLYTLSKSDNFLVFFINTLYIHQCAYHNVGIGHKSTGIFMKYEHECTMKNCKRRVAVLKHMLCKSHVNQLYKTGSPKRLASRKTHTPWRTREKVQSDR